jgi:peptide deformylase
MSVLKIARMGHPVLQTVAHPVEDIRAPEIQRLIDDMIETMEDAPGVGLAAPQVYQPLRILVYKVPEARTSGLPGDEARPGPCQP